MTHTFLYRGPNALILAGDLSAIPFEESIQHELDWPEKSHTVVGNEDPRCVAAPFGAERFDDGEVGQEVTIVEQVVRKHMRMRHALQGRVWTEDACACVGNSARKGRAERLQVEIAREGRPKLVFVKLLGSIVLERLGMHDRDVVALDRILDDDFPIDGCSTLRVHAS
jgi:hypothetical protein